MILLYIRNIVSHYPSFSLQWTAIFSILQSRQYAHINRHQKHQYPDAINKKKWTWEAVRTTSETRSQSRRWIISVAITGSIPRVRWFWIVRFSVTLITHKQRRVYTFAHIGCTPTCTYTSVARTRMCTRTVARNSFHRSARGIRNGVLTRPIVSRLTRCERYCVDRCNNKRGGRACTWLSSVVTRPRPDVVCWDYRITRTPYWYSVINLRGDPRDCVE